MKNSGFEIRSEKKKIITIAWEFAVDCFGGGSNGAFYRPFSGRDREGIRAGKMAARTVRRMAAGSVLGRRRLRAQFGLRPDHRERRRQFGRHVPPGGAGETAPVDSRTHGAQTAGQRKYALL